MKTKKICILFRLPPEIRAVIYRYSFKDDLPAGYLPMVKKWPSIIQSLLPEKKLYEECLTELYLNYNITLAPCSFKWFWNDLSLQSVNSIKSIHLLNLEQIIF
jgi:hypothetical protein